MPSRCIDAVAKRSEQAPFQPIIDEGHLDARAEGSPDVRAKILELSIVAVCGGASTDAQKKTADHQTPMVGMLD
jgi:hypothetical protein